ncbi:hypothetical protein JXA88_13560 [Candidatus Fermentibacteria bacterium]|nr:hypothetical protein [Candidatus Fermentibacteria bacterium]
MNTTVGFGVLAIATAVLGWLAEEALPRRPTGGLKGLIVLGLVSGFFFGWLADALQVGPGPSPGGINLLAGVCGSAASIMTISLATLAHYRRNRP